MNRLLNALGFHGQNLMEHCKSCAHFDKEHSDENWTICPCVPARIMMGAGTDDCENYFPDIRAVENA